MIGLPLILGIAGIGGTAGGINGARIGAQSGSIAGVAAERERRDKAEQLEKEIVSSPAKQQEVIQAYRANPVVEKNDTVEGINATSRTGSEALGKIINWKTTVATVAICTVVSIALFSGAWVLGGGSLLGGTVATAIPLGLGNVGVSSVGGMLAVAIGAGAAMGGSICHQFPRDGGQLVSKNRGFTFQEKWCMVNPDLSASEPFPKSSRKPHIIERQVRRWRHGLTFVMISKQRLHYP